MRKTGLNIIKKDGSTFLMSRKQAKDIAEFRIFRKKRRAK